jgi:hypothetical protein
LGPSGDEHVPLAASPARQRAAAFVARLIVARRGRAFMRSTMKVIDFGHAAERAQHPDDRPLKAEVKAQGHGAICCRTVCSAESDFSS